MRQRTSDRRWRHLIRQRPPALFRSSLIVLMLSNAASVFSYLIQFVLGRVLTPADYGSFNALNSTGLIVASVFMVLPFVVTKFVIGHEPERPVQVAMIRRLTRMGLLAAALLTLLVLLVSPWLASALHLPERMPVYVLALWVGTALMVLLNTGVLNGLLRYLQSTFESFLGQQGLRFVLVVVLVVGLGGSYTAAIAAGVLGNVVAAGLMHWSIRRHFGAAYRASPPAMPTGELRQMSRFALPVALNWLAIGLLTNMDVVIVKHLQSADVAGHYASAAITARIATFLPMALLWVLFPEVVKSTQREESALASILLMLALTVLLSGSYALVVFLWPAQLMRLLFGASYVAAARYVPIVTAAMALVAVLNVIFSACLAKSLYIYLYPTFAGLAATVALIVFWFNQGPAQVATGLLLGCAGLVLVNLGIVTVAVGRPGWLARFARR